MGTAGSDGLAVHHRVKPSPRGCIRRNTQAAASGSAWAHYCRRVSLRGWKIDPAPGRSPGMEREGLWPRDQGLRESRPSAASAAAAATVRFRKLRRPIGSDRAVDACDTGGAPFRWRWVLGYCASARPRVQAPCAARAGIAGVRHGHRRPLTPGRGHRQGHCATRLRNPSQHPLTRPDGWFNVGLASGNGLSDALSAPPDFLAIGTTSRPLYTRVSGRLKQ